MKIQIRKNIFETNSSSTHSLIITNSRDLDKDMEKMKKEEKYFYPEYIRINCHIASKEKKVLMLGGLFNFENKINNCLKDEFQVFLQVLKDNNEKELLKKIEENTLNYKDEYDEPYCTNYFEDGCLIECNCKFKEKFIEYFAKKKVIDENKKELYQKLKSFIYEDGIIIPYEF